MSFFVYVLSFVITYIIDVLISSNHVIEVTNIIDSISEVNNCHHVNSNLNNKCNLRSAWELCSLSIINCVIELPLHSNIIMNMSLGSLVLYEGEMMIIMVLMMIKMMIDDYNDGDDTDFTDDEYDNDDDDD